MKLTSIFFGFSPCLQFSVVQPDGDSPLARKIMLPFGGNQCRAHYNGMLLKFFLSLFRCLISLYLHAYQISDLGLEFQFQNVILVQRVSLRDLNKQI